MIKKIAQYSLIIIFAILFSPLVVNAQDVSGDVFMKYTSPHEVCNYYRSQGVNVVRESDNECMTSIGEGKYTVYTQFYYSDGKWCHKLTQQGQTQYSNCVPIPKDSFNLNNFFGTTFDDFFNDFNLNSQNYPYVIGGAVLVVVIITTAIFTSSIHKANLKSSTPTDGTTEEPEKTFNPKVKRRGHSPAGYDWEEMETTTTEELSAKPDAGPGEGQSQGGVGLHEVHEPIINSPVDELEKLARLKEEGAITQKEFELAKKKLLH